MQDSLQALQSLPAAFLSLEGIAVVLALAYLLLAARESLWCWYCAFVSSALYVVVLWDARLLTESVLSAFYVVMAVVGWYQWRYGGAAHEGVRIVSLRWWQHLVLLAVLLVLAALNGWAMQRWTSAAWPFVDSFITWGSVLTTVLVVRKVLENWLYWLLLDGLAMVVYIDRGLYPTAILFALYLVIVVFGYVKWRREYRGYATSLPVASQTRSAQ
jgi:nicotinamide mononucleotide transporter